MSEPEILVYAAATMNGWKPLILLEELRELDPSFDYALRPIDFAAREQKADWYRALNPNGRIPTIVDRGTLDADGQPFAVFESGAILWYLAEKYGRFLPEGAQARSQTLQWLMFQMSGVGPMMGQAMYFQRIAAPKGHALPYAIERYVNESRRLLEVLDRQLELTGGPYLLGEAYTIADIATYPWARSYPWAKVSIDGLDALQAYLERLDARPAIQRAVQLPKPFPAFFGQTDAAQTADAIAENASKF